MVYLLFNYLTDRQIYRNPLRQLWTSARCCPLCSMVCKSHSHIIESFYYAVFYYSESLALSIVQLLRSDSNQCSSLSGCISCSSHFSYYVPHSLFLIAPPGSLFLIPLFFYLFFCLVLSCLIDVVSLVIFVSLSVSVLQSYFDSTLSAGPNKFVLFAIVNCFYSFYSVRTHVVCVYLPLPHSLSISR